MLRCIVLTLILSACAQSPKHLSETNRKSLGHVGVVSAQFHPKINLILPAKGAGSGAWRGAREGAKDVIIGSALTPLPGAIILGILLSPVAAAGGAVYGAFAAPPARVVARHEKVLTGISQRLEINRSIREGIIRYADEKAHYPLTDLGEIGPAKPGGDANYLHLALNRTDTVLEVSASDLSTEGAAINSPFRISIRVNVYLVRTSDGMVLAAYHPQYAGQLHTLEEWARNDGALFRKELQNGFMQISRETVYELLFVYDPASVEETGSAGSDGKVSIHPPEFTVPRPKKSGFSLFSDNDLIVDSLTPEVCWKPLTGETQKSFDEGTKISSISPVRYQLEVRSDDEIIYERDSLKVSCHRLEQPLRWNGKYSTSVMRWFKLNGHMRATRPGEVHFKTPPMPVSQSGPVHIKSKRSAAVRNEARQGARREVW